MWIEVDASVYNRVHGKQGLFTLVAMVKGRVAKRREIVPQRTTATCQTNILIAAFSSSHNVRFNSNRDFSLKIQ